MSSKNNILISLSESDKTQFGKQGFATQSTPQQVFSLVWAMEAAVNNGGFSRYFQHDSCETPVSRRCSEHGGQSEERGVRKTKSPRRQGPSGRRGPFIALRS